METTQKQKRSPANDAAPDPNPAVNGADGWREVQTDRAIWKPDHDDCAKVSVQGFILGRLDLPRPDGGTWGAYVVKCTAPTLAVDGEEVVKVHVGTEVLVPESAKLQDLRRFVRPDVIVEVRIKTLGTVSIGNGRTMRKFAIAANEKSVQPRRAIHGVERLALPAKVESDVPF